MSQHLCRQHLRRCGLFFALSFLHLQAAVLVLPGNAADTKSLRAGLSEIFNDEKFSDAIWGVQIEDLKSGDVIFQKNGDKLLIPASNQKLLTAAAILLELGPEATFDTQLYRTGPVENGILKGDLVVRGGGDPSLGGRFHNDDITFTFRQWASTLKQAGIQQIEGRIIGDDNIFDDVAYGAGWQVDYLAHWYAAEISALSFNDNCIDLLIRPGGQIGKPAAITVRPDTNYLEIINKSQTVSKLPRGAGQLREIDIRRDPDSRRLRIHGPVLAKAKQNLEWASVPNPTLFAVTVLKEVLEKEGIKVNGEAQDIDQAEGLSSTADSVPQSWVLVHTEKSPPLSELLKVYLQNSQNLYGECFLKYLGYASTKQSGTSDSGIKRMKQLLKRVGVPEDGYRPMDGSGLARGNLITAEAFCRLLAGMAKNPHAETFKNALPLSGKRGSLDGRMRNTKAEGRVLAKTGYISRVRTLSGYVESRNGDTYVFSFLANNFRTSVKEAERLQDKACVLLVQ